MVPTLDYILEQKIKKEKSLKNRMKQKMYENISDFDLGKLFLSQKNTKDELAEKRLIDK